MSSIVKFLKNYAALILIIPMGVFLSCSGVFAQGGEPVVDNAVWVFTTSNYFIIYYHPDADLEKIKKELDRRPLYFDQAARYGDVSTLGEICYRLDKLFNRVRETLDVYPKAPKTKIMICKDRPELNEEYFKLIGKRGDVKAFYVHKLNTIYASEDDMEDSVMIHEMAHAVIDHYFPVMMPERAREILASYVDAHLEE